jgi:predicted metalloprotease with PDZ domain
MKLLFSLLAGLFSMGAFAQQLHYSIRFPNAVHHEASVVLDVTGAPAGTLVFRMSRSSPGRYATHEFGKNVYDVTATDLKGNPLTIKRTEGDVYEVSGGKGAVRLSYTLYGNHADGTYLGIDENSMQLNMPASFMWVKGLEKAPISLDIELPDPSLTIATQLPPGKNPNSFTASGLQYFMDSPIKIGKLHWREWKVNNKGRELTMRLSLEATATEAGVDSLANMVKSITRQAAAVFGEYPAYDFGSYTFISSMNPFVRGDGMEHRNSTMISLPIPFTTNPGAVEVYSHEFFHCWNVERIRPKTLEPFNFEKSNMSNELWCAEGFTQYYGDLLMVRAGTETDTSFALTAGSYINSKTNTPGGRLYTPIQASNMAVFTDAGVAIDKTNYGNITTSYYIYGASVALALDLTLRGQFNSSLDRFMQEMWKRHGKTEIPYTVADMEKALAAITNAGFAKDFFSRYVYAPGLPDYASLLAKAGFELRRIAPGKAWLGNLRFNETNGLALSAPTVRGTPLYVAGLDVDDVLLKADNQELKSSADLI